MKLHRILIILIIAVALVSCRTNKRKDKLGQIKHYGSIESIMAGDFSKGFDLDSLASLESLYALGAMDSMAGEIQIFDSEPFNSMVIMDSVIVGPEATPRASLIIYSQVNNWKEISMPLSVSNREALIGFLQYNTEIDESENQLPYFFLIDGVVEQLNWHVLNQVSGDSLNMSKDHLKNAVSGTIEDVEVEILGVYSTEHEGIFTHHNMPIHMHFRTSDGSLAGHIDDLELGPEMRLRIPSGK